MPKVPTYSSPTVQEAAAPMPMQNANPAQGAFGEGIARGLSNASNVFQQVADDADNLRVQDAYNQMRERQLDLTLNQKDGFTNVKGRDVMTPGANGKAMSDNYLERFDGEIGKIESGLASERQKAIFRQKANDSKLQFRSSLQQHENSQITEYGKNVTNATILLETEAAAKDWNKPEVVGMSIANIRDSLTAQGMREGIPADMQKAIIADKVSAVHGNVLAMALENRNLTYAEKYLAANSKDMNAAEVLKYKGQVTKEIEHQSGVQAGLEAITIAAPKIMPNDIDRLNDIQFQQESGNRQVDKNGVPITSEKGAIGIAQVMPKTGPEAAKMAGLPWDEQRYKTDLTYNKALGVAYRNEMLKKYGGDLPKALAAYNGGPGRLDEAIKQATKDGKPGEWLSYMPPETRKYVPAILNKYSNGSGGMSRMTEADVVAQVRARTDLTPAAKVIAEKTAVAEFERLQKAKRQGEQDATGEAYKWLDANNGNYGAMPPSLRASLPGDQIDNLQRYAAQRAKGIEPATDWNVYYELKKDATLLKSTNLLAFKGVLAEPEFKALVNEQNDLKSGKGDSVTTTRSANQLLNQYLIELGVDPTPKPGSKDAPRVGIAMRLQQEAITAAETAKGGKLTPAEVEKETARLFTKVEVKGAIFGSNTKARFEVTDKDRVIVPAADRELIVAALKATKRPVNETFIREMYAKKNNLPTGQ